MESVSPDLVKALNELGLSTTEAVVYAALVLYDNAEAKDLIEYLSLSKPSVYEALDRLSDIGLAVKRVSKPARYSPVSPHLAIDLIMGSHRKAADRALAELEKLELLKVGTEKEEALWTIYGEKSTEYKIRDLFRKAKKEIRCMIGERYLPCLENIHIKDIALQLLVISEKPGLEQKLKGQFPGKKASIRVISTEIFSTPPPFAPQEFKEMQNLMTVENTLELIVDNEELLLVPPFLTNTISVLNTRNKGAILQIKMINQMNWKRFIEEDTFPFLPQPSPGKNQKPGS